MTRTRYTLPAPTGPLPDAYQDPDPATAAAVILAARLGDADAETERARGLALVALALLAWRIPGWMRDPVSVADEIRLRGVAVCDGPWAGDGQGRLL